MFVDGEKVYVAFRHGGEVKTASFPATRSPFPSLPLLRGVGNLYAMVRDVYRASALSPETRLNPLEALLAALLTLLLSGGLFAFAFLLPARAVSLLVDRASQPFLWYLGFEFSSLVLLVLALRLMALLPWSGRVLQLHGAEHQVAHALERGLPLEEEAVAAMPHLHPRCGTNFLAFSALVAALFYALVLPLESGHPLFWPLKLLLLPVAVGLGYEAFLLAQRLPSLLRLGYLFQRFTVAPPAPEDREVALAAARQAS